MTENDKNKYFSYLVTGPLTYNNDIEEMNHILSLLPKSLYKYSPCSEKTFKNIKNRVQYLCPIEKLDDPFECVVDLNDINIFEENSKNHSKAFIGKLAENFIKKEKYNLPKKMIVDILMRRKPYKPIREIEGKELLKKYKIIIRNEGHEKKALTQIFNLSIFYSDERHHYDVVNQFSNPKKHIGLCSLSETKNNQVMWSLYCANYTGICIEYDVPHDSYDVLHSILPVKYRIGSNNSLIDKLTDFYIGNLNMAIKKREDYRIGNIFDTICTKNHNWKFQREWRIWGRANQEVKLLKIKAIYIGCYINKENEQQILDIAKEQKFDVYKMNVPDNSKKLKFTNVFNSNL